ncbi:MULTISPECIES: 50S ribosomal protein L29 [Geobacter]|uniref:Large ribosomal subunit protein uL29 n=2 Tax=Geobacter TaxID=28231 RepID=A0A0C1QR29_9BACT|nr:MULTISPECIES: 50S ribosomal protein L29 [Geobacter]ANA41097.1 50S ribosomal protein L29 [Geobacter anodireducens]KIE43217.1 50S ribosomal protein L29 [Geobacter soli]MBE2888241.1 50S ribosomal protein L29 [Geobacter anodireducens]HMN02887.1 50S ribosomal protein L29 [Geobacter anodireducens]
MKASELKNKSLEELTTKAAELSQELFNLRFQLHTGRLENTAKISSVKKDIARIKTILSEKRG